MFSCVMKGKDLEQIRMWQNQWHQHDCRMYQPLSICECHTKQFCAVADELFVAEISCNLVVMYLLHFRSRSICHSLSRIISRCTVTSSVHCVLLWRSVHAQEWSCVSHD